MISDESDNFVVLVDRVRVADAIEPDVLQVDDFHDLPPLAVDYDAVGLLATA